ncbi:hypothetical protein HPP92_015781 [Vanilla planifolia]|uniref:EamA domain-containing protein n=1 Tax=Vanilla planifolia TaxID=51239 RepID=A0A835USQ6_VANPL|nr:hypothetical protein HPP92_016396 [Vanilla planifolia]KAG0471235.1 hypothetical protein HPP92_015781 [Vanilla planifolia]
MLLQQFSFAVMYIILISTLKGGMSQPILLVYRNLVAVVVVAPFAFFVDSKKEKLKMTPLVFIKIMGLAFLGPVMDQNFYYMGAKMTSAAFASSMENLNPSITLLLALMLRIEKLDIKSRHGKAKVIGSFLAIAGAFLMVFYRGPTIEFLWSEAREHQGNSNAVVQEEAKGAVVNFVVALFVEHGRVQPLILGWDKRLFAIIYSGIVCSGLSYVLLAIAMKEKGPVFVSCFNPCCMIMTAIMGIIFLGGIDLGIKWGNLLSTAKPYAAMLLQQFSFAVMYIILTSTLKGGMSQPILLVYRNLVAVVVVAPFAFFVESKKEKLKMTPLVFIKIMGLAFLGPVMGQNFYYMGAKMTSAAFASSMENLNPSITLLLALILRIEKLDIKSRHGKAKVIGSFLAIAGAFLMVFYRGPTIEFLWSEAREHQGNSNAVILGGGQRLIGTFILLASSICWCSSIILQSNILRSFPAKFTIITLICFKGAVVNFVVALFVEYGRVQPWILGWDKRLFVIIYSGIVCSGLSYVLLAIVMKEKGPVFVSCFNPCCMTMTAIMGITFLGKGIELGMIIGSIIIMFGLYSVWWAKSKDQPNETTINNDGKENLVTTMVFNKHYSIQLEDENAKEISTTQTSNDSTPNEAKINVIVVPKLDVVVP